MAGGRSHVAPVGFEHRPDGAIVARVLQTVRELGGAQTHGLKDETVAVIAALRVQIV